MLQHDVADGVLNRIDRIVMRLNHLTRRIEILVKKGTFASSPTAPGLVSDEDYHELALADVYISAGATSISQSNITDARFNSDLCGIVSGVVDQIDTTNLFAQYDAEFNEWFETAKGQLSGDVAGNLQNQITELDQEVTSHKADTTTAHGIGNKLDKIVPAGEGVTFNTSGVGKGRMFTLPGIPNWLGWVMNAQFTSNGWVLDDPNAPGWFFKLDSRAGLSEFACYKIPAGAGNHTDEYAVFKVSAADDKFLLKDNYDVKSEIDNLKQSVSDGKNSVETAIEGKGGTVADTNNPPSFADLVNGVNSIPQAQGNATTGDVLSGKTFTSATYGAAVQTGTIPNNGRLDYTPSASVQNIPAGYTSGGTIAAAVLASGSLDYSKGTQVINNGLGAYYDSAQNTDMFQTDDGGRTRYYTSNTTGYVGRTLLNGSGSVISTTETVYNCGATVLYICAFRKDKFVVQDSNGYCHIVSATGTLIQKTSSSVFNNYVLLGALYRAGVYYIVAVSGTKTVGIYNMAGTLITSYAGSITAGVNEEKFRQISDNAAVCTIANVYNGIVYIYFNTAWVIDVTRSIQMLITGFGNLAWR